MIVYNVLLVKVDLYTRNCPHTCTCTCIFFYQYIYYMLFQVIEIDPESEEVFPGIQNMASELRVRVYMYYMYIH